MSPWIVLLRAVNVGGRPYPMAQLRDVLTAEGYTGVETYIQTGNVRLESPVASPAELSERLESLFAQDRGFEVPTVVLTPDELSTIVTDLETLVAEVEPADRHYVYVLRDAPGSAEAADLEALAGPHEAVHVRGRAVHLLTGADGVHGTKVTINRVERLAGVATNRNAKVLRTLAQRWGEPVAPRP